MQNSNFVNLLAKKYNICMNLLAREQIKSLLAQESVKLKDLAILMSERTGKNCAPNVLSRKLSKGTLSYNEAVMIADLLGYEINFNKTKNDK